MHCQPLKTHIIVALRLGLWFYQRVVVNGDRQKQLRHHQDAIVRHCSMWGHRIKMNASVQSSDEVPHVADLLQVQPKGRKDRADEMALTYVVCDTGGKMTDSGRYYWLWGRNRSHYWKDMWACHSFVCNGRFYYIQLFDWIFLFVGEASWNDHLPEWIHRAGCASPSGSSMDSRRRVHWTLLHRIWPRKQPRRLRDGQERWRVLLDSTLYGPRQLWRCLGGNYAVYVAIRYP